MNEEKSDKLRIIPLGGVEEIGINCTAFEYNNRIVVVDMGLGFPDETLYGIDYVVPNVDYLEKRKSKIEGIVITHGHLDHIGGLPFLLERLDFPEILGTEFTIELIKTKLADHKLENKVRFRVINENSQLQAGSFQLSFFRVNHSIPQCVGVVINTPAGRIVHTGDFKFDNSPINEPVADYARIAKIGEQGVDLLLSDSTNSLRPGHPISESAVAESMEEIIENAPGRVVISTFSGLVGRLYQIIKIAEQQKRKIAIAGYSMNQTLRIAREIGYIRPGKGVIVPINAINRYNDDKVIILTTGSQGESNAALAKMVSEEGYRRKLKLKQGDTVVISAGTIPGNHLAVQTLIDRIVSTGATVHQSESMDFFTSGHGYQEDQKIMLNLTKPKYFMPVHGYQYFLQAHSNTAQQVGVPAKNIIIAKRGNIIEFNRKDGYTINGQVKNTPLLVSGTGVGDIGTQVLSERQQLGNYGVLIISMLLDVNQHKIIQKPEITTRGFVYVRASKDILQEVERQVEIEINKLWRGRLKTVTDLERSIENRLRGYIKKEIEREPIILPLVSTTQRQ